jgi:dienelactone hydrolase
MDASISTRDVTYYSEAVRSRARLYLPAGFTASSNAAAVILAPGLAQTAETLSAPATELARAGLVAMTIDYRGWGRSGAFIYLADAVRWDDRLRFSQHTAKVRLRRKRLLPEAQVIDIRNAITFLQSEPGVDGTRIGLWGSDLAGAHVVAIAATDARLKAGVALQAIDSGKGTERRSFAPGPAQQASMIKLARSGSAPASIAAAAAMNDEEARLALADYQPFRLLDQIPPATSLLYLDGPVIKDAVSFLAKALSLLP